MDTEQTVLALTEEQAEYAMHLTGENYWQFIEAIIRERTQPQS